MSNADDASPTPALRRGYLLGMAAMYLFAAVFYWRQNSGDAPPGGPISVVKALWLGLTLFWWFAVPLMLLRDRRLSRAAHVAFLAFTTSMLLRGAVELVMIYVLFNWHCYYGIAHDLLTGALLLFCASRLDGRDALDRTMRRHLGAMAGMFAFETYFAWSFHHQIRLKSPELYFVPENWSAYGSILGPTAVGVVLVIAYSVPFTRAWLRGAPPSPLIEDDLLDHLAAVRRLGKDRHS